MPLLFHCCAKVSCSSATVWCGKSWNLIPPGQDKVSGRVFCAGLGELEIQKARHWIACGQATCMPLLFHCCAKISCSSATVWCGKSWNLIPCLPFLSKLLTVIGLVQFEPYLRRYASSEKANCLLKHLWKCSCKLLNLSAWTLRQFLGCMLYIGPLEDTAHRLCW